jgi:SAM-dependent MidA family methyltransferase
LYTSQANFLINAGILNLMEKISPEDKMNYVKMSSGIQTLVSPSEMGDLVKVMAITKNIDLDFAEFSRNDRTFNL